MGGEFAGCSTNSLRSKLALVLFFEHGRSSSISSREPIGRLLNLSALLLSCLLAKNLLFSD